VLTPPMLLGFGLVIAGSVLATRRPATPPEPADAGALAAEAQAGAAEAWTEGPAGATEA
jgi:hypothetical protein